MSKESKGGDLESQQSDLGDAFFAGDAEEHREHLQLVMEESAAREQIAEATGIHDPSVLRELAGLRHSRRDAVRRSP